MDQEKKLHFIHARLTIVLLLSGLLLYGQVFRGLLADVHIYLRTAHILLGCGFAITVAIYVWIFVAKWSKWAAQPARKGRNGAFILLAGGIIFTGFLLVIKIDVATATGLSALSWHKSLVVVGVLALLFHGFSGVWLKKDTSQTGELPLGARTNRRIFLGWAAAVGALFSGGLVFNWLQRSTTGPQGVKKTAKFLDCNQMATQPVPSLGSVPPLGGGYKGEFEVFTVTKIPCVSSDSWQLRLFGLVDKPSTFSWDEFLAIPRTVQISDFYCITGWTVYQATYEGVLLSQLLNLGGVQAAAAFVKFYSGDGVYTSALSLDQAKMADVMLAVLLDGKPIPSDLGGPVRLIVPKMYAYKGVKWVNGVELIQEPHIGYWESRGYANDPWVKKP